MTNDHLMNNQPKVSIVTPSYNAMQYIQETVESIHSQAYPNLEHIIYDGGSKDGTTEWVTANYPQIIYTSEKDRGQSHALNKGFQRATGEIIGWLNADDVYMPSAIQKAVDYLVAHPEVDMVCTDLNIIDEKSRHMGLTKSRPFDVVGLLFYNPIKQPTVFMRRRVIDALKGVDEQYHYVMDREFWLRAGMAGFNMAYLPGEIFAKFRLCRGTKSFEDTPNFRDEWYAVMQKAFQEPFFQKTAQVVKAKALADNRAGYHTTMAVKAIDAHQRGEAFSQLIKAGIFCI
jgi:glycosyltransferase involved in cell wall biosynthesis